jgi:hypothetical protein
MRKPMLLLFAMAFVLVVLAFAENRHASCGAEIVADKSFTNQTTPFSSTIYTPTADGTYRISLYVEMFGADNQTFLTSAVFWTDDVGLVGPTVTTNPPLACGFAPPVSRCDVVGIIHAKANTPISVNIVQMNLSPGGSYNAYVVLENLKKGERRSD